MRNDTPQVGYAPYRQIHAHSTANPGSTAQNEADYMQRKNLNSGFYTHVVGNGVVIQTAPTNRGAWDVGGGWNAETYAAVELIESHKTKEEFVVDYKIYVDLLRKLAVQAGIPTTLDSGDLAGIKTHEYCTKHQPYNASDHVDPYPYLSKWGISRDQFKRDVESGNISAQPTTPPQSKPQPKPQSTGYKPEPYNVPQITDTALNVRTSPNTQSNIVRVLPAGYRFNATRIVRNGENVNGYTTWCEVNDVGWASMAYTTPAKNEPPKPATPQVVKASGYFTVRTATNIRNAPSTSSQIVGVYQPGEGFNYDGYVDTNGYRWLTYISYSGQRRYVAQL